ncbi:penicillin-insensitive murein endopeptidase [Pontibacter sp. G13]|uniref:penicillin-insensitive murein endopeptidase n=1 Tax=Pontibacter sp. G13 TaxID=3074898 RepID=UPI002889A767|nr:penicillin-insensitive murein endopeptidase [Pontibacter sp. G13]WNJ17331.1 penicillin-insensitive murein endopeptidase [Pontibacter sp. G13]
MDPVPSYRFVKYGQVRPKRGRLSGPEAYRILLDRIRMSPEEQTVFKAKYRNVLEQFGTHLLDNIYWYNRKIDIERNYQILYLAFSFGVLLLLPIIVGHLELRGSSWVVELSAVLTGVFALHSGIAEWLEKRNRIGTFWMASSSLKTRLYSLEDRWKPQGRTPFDQDSMAELAADLEAATRFAFQIQQAEQQVFFDSFSYPKFDLLGSVLKTRRQVRSLLGNVAAPASDHQHVHAPTPQERLETLTLQAPLANDSTEKPTVTPPATLLTGSVGVGGVNNLPDAAKVKDRLVALGFDWAELDADGQPADGMIDAIKLFQSIIWNRVKVISDTLVDGRIDVLGQTANRLFSDNPPKWSSLPESGPGYRYKVSKASNGDDRWGTNYLISAITEAGQHFHAANGGTKVFHVHELASKRGGKNGSHKTHQTGLDVDVRLTKLNGVPGGITYHSDQYDQEATRQTLQAFKQLPFKTYCIFNDPVLIAEELCVGDKDGATWHDNHIHIRVHVPQE